MVYIDMIFLTQDETKNGRVALWYAASEGHNAVTHSFAIKSKSYFLHFLNKYNNSNKMGHVPITCFVQVLYFLLREKHKSYSLLEDRRVRKKSKIRLINKI